MARSRVAVALVLPEPIRTEVDGLRRATGGDRERIAPHITLVPPVNVRDEDLSEALGLLRGAAADQEGPLTLTIGPAATFAPANRVVYLEVGGSDSMASGLEQLRAALLRGPLHREERRRFVPHVTLSHHLVDGDDAHALAVLAGYRAEVTFERVDLLSFDDEARRWSTIADVVLGPRRVVGRGGLALELTTSSRCDPEVLALCAGSDPGHTADTAVGADRTVVVAARREGRVVGVAVGSLDAPGEAHLHGVLVAPDVRRQGIGDHLLATLSFELARRGASRCGLRGEPDDATRELLRARGWDPATTTALTTALSG